MTTTTPTMASKLKMTPAAIAPPSIPVVRIGGVDVVMLEGVRLVVAVLEGVRLVVVGAVVLVSQGSNSHCAQSLIGGDVPLTVLSTNKEEHVLQIAASKREH